MEIAPIREREKIPIESVKSGQIVILKREGFLYDYIMIVTQFKEENTYVQCVDMRDGEVINVPYGRLVVHYPNAKLYLEEKET